jgi:hypothetical protein
MTANDTRIPVIDPVLLRELAHYHEELIDFHNTCVSFCDAISALLESSTEFERSTLHGLTSFCIHMKERTSLLKNAFQRIQDSLHNQSSTSH